MDQPVKFQFRWEGSERTIEVSYHATFGEVREEISKVTGLEPAFIKMLLKGKHPKDDVSRQHPINKFKKLPKNSEYYTKRLNRRSFVLICLRLIFHRRGVI